MGDRRIITLTHKALALSIVRYVMDAHKAGIEVDRIEEVIAGYLEQMELAVRGAIHLEISKHVENLRRPRDNMDRMDGG